MELYFLFLSESIKVVISVLLLSTTPELHDKLGTLNLRYRNAWSGHPQSEPAKPVTSMKDTRNSFLSLIQQWLHSQRAQWTSETSGDASRFGRSFFMVCAAQFRFLHCFPHISIFFAGFIGVVVIPREDVCGCSWSRFKCWSLLWWFQLW